MRDFRKFCRPNFSKNSKTGDPLVKLKCGEIGAMSEEEYVKVLNFFEIDSFIGEDSPNSPGNIVVTNKETGKQATFSVSDYNSIKDRFEIVDIIGSEKTPFNNHEYVDLGLPSGTLWATMNVGASSETEVGNYYKFGETTIYDGTDYNTSAYNQSEDLPLENDAANANFGGSWHIPTKTLWDELINNTTHTWINDYNSSGVNVIKFAKTDDSSIFIIVPATGSYQDGLLRNPDTGYYWASTLRYGSAEYAVFTENSYFHADWKCAYGHGLAVRAVCDSVEGESLATIGDIICHNSILNVNSIFTYDNWLTLDDDWEFEGIYGVNTYTKTNTIVGDIVIKSNNTITFINPSNWSNVSNNWEAIGIVGIESRNTPDSKVRILSLDYMDYNNPTTGNSGTGVYMYWGADGDISGLSNKNLVPCMSTSDNTALTDSILRAVGYSRIPTDYFNVEASAIEGYKYTTISDGLYHPSMYLEDGSINPDAIVTLFMIPGTSTSSNINNASADFDGLNNTSKIMSLCTVDTPINSYDSGNYPAAQCCSLYNKGNLLWYLPASGELACIVANFNKINNSRVAVGFNNYSYLSYYYWSSTVHSSSNARNVGGLNGYCSSSARDSSSSSNRVLAVSAF